MAKHQLTLSPNYVQDWTYNEAVRELFQNALDNQTVSPENEMFFEYKDNKLTIGNKTSILTLDTLLLGSSSKRNDPKTIGKHGEGYKVAFMVLLREGKSVTVYNYGAKEVWRTRLVKSRKYNGALITEIDVDKKFFWQSVPSHNLTIEIEGVTKEEYLTIVEHNLHLQPYPDNYCVSNPKEEMGYILTDKKFKGKVFVNGLYICHNDKFSFGYDIMPEFITLDRDRKLIDSIDLAFITSKMWRYTGDEAKIAGLILKDVLDVKYLKDRKDWGQLLVEAEIDNKIAVALQEKFIEKHGDKAVPVSDNSDLKRVSSASKEYTPILVSKGVTDYLKDKIETPVAVGLTPKEQLKEWFEKIQHKLSEEEAFDFELIFEEIWWM